MSKIRPFLWFTEGAREALEHYAKVFEGSTVAGLRQDDGDQDAPFFSGQLKVGDAELIIFNGGPYAAMVPSPAISLFVECEDQAEVDALWSGLSEGGSPSRCGWVTDRFGITWQIVPRLFNELMGSEDPAVRERVTAAMLQMEKFDCQALLDASRA